MNPARWDELDYIQFLVTAQGVLTCSQATRCQPASPGAPAHDAFTRLLRRQPPDTAALWQEVAPLVEREAGVLVLDDTTLDKPYSKKMELVSRYWSDKHGRVVWGINLMTLLWPGGNALLPCTFRIYDKPLSGLTKNDHFRQMLMAAGKREFQPQCVLFDSWYSNLQNLKAVRAQGWSWLTQFRSHRLVNPDGAGNVKVGTLEIPLQGRTDLRGYGWVKVFRTVSTDGDVEHWSTSDLVLTPERREDLAGYASWAIELKCIIVASNSAVAWKNRPPANRKPSAITWGCPCKPFCGWNSIDYEPGSVGMKPKPASSVTPCPNTSPILGTNSPQLRNSYVI